MQQPRARSRRYEERIDRARLSSSQRSFQFRGGEAGASLRSSTSTVTRESSRPFGSARLPKSEACRERDSLTCQFALELFSFSRTLANADSRNLLSFPKAEYVSDDV